MQNRKDKITITVGAFAVLAAGFIFLNTAAAQTSGANCNSSTSGFWGHIYCTMTQLVGSPSQGISGAGTLFKGQRAIYDRIGTSSGSTQTSGTGVYIEKAGSSIHLGTLADPNTPGGNSFWGCSSVSGADLFDCPQHPVDNLRDELILAVFHPTPAKASEYSVTRRGVTVKPSLCFVKQDNVTMNNEVSIQKQGVPDVERVAVWCSFSPQICMSTHSSGVGQNGCLGRNDVQRVIADYTVNIPAPADQYRIRIK